MQLLNSVIVLDFQAKIILPSPFFCSFLLSFSFLLLFLFFKTFFDRHVVIRGNILTARETYPKQSFSLLTTKKKGYPEDTLEVGRDAIQWPLQLWQGGSCKEVKRGAKEWTEYLENQKGWLLMKVRLDKKAQLSP